MSKKIIYYPEATILKSYDTFVAFKTSAAVKTKWTMVTEQHYSKTTTRQINEFFGGKRNTEKAAIVPQSLLDQFGKFIEAHK